MEITDSVATILQLNGQRLFKLSRQTLLSMTPSSSWLTGTLAACL